MPVGVEERIRAASREWIRLTAQPVQGFYDLLLAGSTLATLPVIALFILFRRQFMAGTAVTGTGIQ